MRPPARAHLNVASTTCPRVYAGWTFAVTDPTPGDAASSIITDAWKLVTCLLSRSGGRTSGGGIVVPVTMD